MYCSIVSAIASSSSSSEYSWSESRLKSGDLNSSRLRVLKCLLDDRNSHSVSVPDNQYAVSNGSGYAVLISWIEHTVLDRELDTPYPMEVDTLHGYAVSSLMDTAYWSSEQPTGRTFTIVGNACPLTRITTTTEAPLRKSVVLDNETSKPAVTLVYSRKPRKSKTNIPVSKSKVLPSVSANNKEPSKSWGSIISDVPSYSLNECRSSKLSSGLLKLKFEKDHLCSACAMGKSKKKPHKPKSEDTNQEKLYLLHMDLCGPMRVASVNGKKYILVIVDDYSRFTWVKFLRTDNGTEFVNQTLREYYEKVGISHETSVARSPQQNGVVERRNRTLIEAARTMLIYAKAPLFLWAEAVATACYTQNRSIIRLRHGKTPYELLHDKLPDLSFFHVFGALCYPTNDSEKRIIETIHVYFDEAVTAVATNTAVRTALHEMTLATISSGLVPNPHPSTPFVPPSRNDWGSFCFQPLI
ncbi:retrovirus-related pol polyprotein from transposon TNT 1-94 [Tanacetum coccineum]